MIFERKEIAASTATVERKNYFWVILQGYWFILPSIYFVFVLPQLAQNAQEVPLSIADLSIMVFQLLNFSMAANMYLMSAREQSRQGMADKFLKISMLQQFIIQNIFGLILAFLAWYRLPKPDLVELESEENEKPKVKPKTNLTWVIVNTILSLAFASVQMFL